jgi:lipopolysaccharide transport protein LptA
MKRALSLVLACASLIALAAESTTVGPDETEITSSRFVFDQRAEIVHFEESVRVFNPGVITLTCEDLIAKLPRGGGVESIVATTNVMIQFTQGKSTNYATGDRAVYTKTNEVFTLTGNVGGKRPRLFQEGMSVEANTVTLNLANGQYKFEGNPVFRGKLGTMRGFDAFGKSTNAPAR